MFQHILMPLDGSRLGEGIIPSVGQLAQGFGSRVTVLYVASLEEAASATPVIARVPQGTKVTVAAYLREMEERVARYGAARVDSAMASGIPAVEILHHAGEGSCDLIAMATHGRSGLGRWVYGSTTDKVLHSSACPMLILRPQEGDPPSPDEKPVQTAVVPLDGSDLAESALPVAQEVAKRLDLKVALVRVVPTTAMFHAGAEPYAYDPRFDEALERAAEDYLRAQSKQLQEQGLHVAYHRPVGHAASQIIDLAERTGRAMMVMSTHGRTGMRRWVLGSVADRVLRSSHQPVLLVRNLGA